MPEQEKEQPSSVVSFGSYRLDGGTGQVWRGKQEVKVTPKAFAALGYFVAHPGQLVTKDELFTAVWPQTIVTEATLASCIQELRSALRDDARAPRYIETVHRRGFRFIAAVAAAPGPSAEGQGPSQEEGEPAQEGNGARGRGDGERVFALDPQTSDLGLRTSDSRSQILAPRLSDPRHQTRELDATAPSAQRAWSSRNVALAGVVLLLGLIAIVHYLSQPSLSTQDSALSPGAPHALPLPDKPSIIVLPFTNMSEDPAQEYFSDGMTEELTSRLSRLPSLFVIARHSAFTYKGKAVKVQEVSKEMGVRYVLEGSVRKAGDQLRITAQLIDGTTGGHVWSDRYDRQLRDIFALQDEITQQIVVAFRVEIGKAELRRVRRIPTENLTAYDFYLRGLESSFRVASETKKEENAHARQMFEKAVELDPTYAEAYVGLSRTYFDDWFYQWANDRAQALEQAFEMAQRAVALDDSLPGAHQLLGHIYVWKRQYEQAIAEGQQAIALDPNDADGYARLGTILIFAGQSEESIRLLEKAIRLNPRSPIFYYNNLGLAYRVAGRYEEALALLERLLARNPNVMVAYLILAYCYAELGRLEEARAAGAEVMRLNPNWSMEFVRTTPWKDPAIVERNIAALHKAGLK